jgi:hypothetical protein
MKPMEVWVLVVLIYVAVVLIFVISHPHAQEQPARQTRTWRAFELPYTHVASGADVDVIDTEGVCLYVARGTSGEYHLTPVAIAAVPNTQLPPGTGCQ